MMGSRMVLVSGTGRSGTSITAEMLHRLGVRMLHSGAQVRGGPNNANPTGTWEDKGLADLTEAWARGNQPRRAALYSQLLILCRARCEAAPAWGFKDPRITEASSLWEGAAHELMEEGSIEGPPLLVLAHRELAAVERSLIRAYSLPATDAREWLAARLSALATLEETWERRGWPIWRVDFKELVTEPMAVAAEAYDQLVELGAMAGIEGNQRLLRLLVSVEHIRPDHVRSGMD